MPVSRQLAGTRLYQEKSVEKHEEHGTVSEGTRTQVKTDVYEENQNTRKERLLARKRLSLDISRQVNFLCLATPNFPHNSLKIKPPLKFYVDQEIKASI